MLFYKNIFYQLHDWQNEDSLKMIIKKGIQSFKKNILQGTIIWFLGWVIFTIVEILFRAINGGPPLPFSISLLVFTIYSGLGIAAGFILGAVSTFLLRIIGKRLKPIKVQCFFMASCVATIILFYEGIVINEQLLCSSSNFVSLLGNLGFILFCLFILVVLYLFFTRIADTSHLLASFLALSLSVDVFMVGGFYINESLLPGKFLAFHLRNILINFGILNSCIALYFLLNTSFVCIGSGLGIINKRLHFRTTVMGLIVLSIVVGSVWYSRPHSMFKKPVGELRDKPNLILITMDTTRADHLSCYGYHRKTTPHLDEFAEGSVLFKNTYSPSSWTLPAHASLFTGMYPAKHGARVNSDFTRYLLLRYGTELKAGFGINSQGIAGQSTRYLEEENTTLAELLLAKGYKTAGVIAGPWCLEKFGLGQGFTFYDNTLYNPDYDVAYFALCKIVGRFVSLLDFVTKYGIEDWGKTASQVNEVAFNWLEKNYTQPFFLFLNYFDPHHPYSPPKPFDGLFSNGNKDLVENFNNPEGVLGFIKGQRRLLHAVLNLQHKLSEVERNVLVSQYDGEIRYLDYHINRLFQKLKRLKIYDNTMIIVTSDHGESFGSHDIITHGYSLYQEELKIPLIIKYPSSQPLKGVVDNLVSLVDILPTIMSTLGFSVGGDVQGKILPDAGHSIIAESYNNWRKILLHGHRFNRDLKAYYDGPFKYIWGSNGCELYNIENDPQELNNLIKEMPKKAREMQALLDDWSTSFIPVISSKFTKVDKITEESLRALGYLP